jgi:endonuclease YncB( thermonuclease family)
MARYRTKPGWRKILGLTLFFTVIGYQAVYNWFPNFFPMEAFIGRARAVDGDSIKLNGQSIRLFGIDAPEYNQACAHPDDKQWPCGRLSHKALKELLANQSTTCHPIKKDVYRRVLASCFTDDGNLAEQMVQNGWAFAYSRYSEEFSDEEEAARRAKRGIWQAQNVTPPWQHRKNKSSLWTSLTGFFGIED